ncbi:MAG: pyrimidine 5'-nucleotidase [Alphaproteobacteria bacterium]
MTPNLGQINTWLFDLDDTLYPAETELMTLIRTRITDFVMNLTGADRDTAYAIQRGWFLEHGAALPGLLAEYNVTAEAFLTYVHDVPLDRVPPDPDLRAALVRLPGRRLIFTNGAEHHAARVLERIGVADLFEGVFHILSADLVPKPAPPTYDKMVATFNLAPAHTAYFEDSERNLEHAAALGMTTILVGPHAPHSTAPFINYRTLALTPFLQSIRFQDPRP